MSNYPDGFGSRLEDWRNPMSPLYDEETVEGEEDATCPECGEEMLRDRCVICKYDPDLEYYE